MKPIVKIVIFIGLLILIGIVCIYAYKSYEGFQSTGSATFCNTNENKCAKQCLNTVYEPGGIRPENTDEQLMYDVYEINNLDKIIATNENINTNVDKYDMASELSEFDTGAPIPWDYENRTKDPGEILWGTVHSDVSKMIFDKAYTRAIFGSANPAEYIENNNDTGENVYRSNVFATTVYTPEAAAAIQVAEGFEDQWVSLIMEDVVERMLNNFDPNRERTLKIYEKMNASKPTIKIGGIDTGITRGIMPTKSYTQAAAEYDAEEAERVAKEKEKIASKVGRSVDDAAVKNMGESKAGALSRLKAMREKYNAYKGRARDAVKNLSKYALKGLAIVLKPVIAALRYVTKGLITKAARKFVGQFVKKALQFIGKIIAAEGTVGGICAGTIATLTAAIAQAQTAATAAFATVVGAPIGIALQAEVADLTSRLTLVTMGCAFIETMWGVIMVSLITWVPALLSTLVDSTFSQCPSDCQWNLERAFMEAPGGEVGWQIFSSVPVIGDFSYVFGPYFCWGTPGGVLTSKLKENIKTPYYYFDPTLSIYTSNKPYAKVPDPNAPTTGTLVASGISENLPEYIDHYLYKDYNGQYPFLVDFSHKIMLDKMAQYYYNMSRKKIYINADGTGTFEYISKIYGVISSTELSCDIQCELTEVTIDLMRGTKLCEKIVEVPPDAPCWHHDRRFYFYIDITKGASLDTPENARCSNYMKYLQTPTTARPYPSCSSLPATGNLNSSECQSMTSINSIYDLNNKVVGQNVINMGTMCNKRLLMDTAVPGLGPRSSWNKTIRMRDNMDKYFVSGCTNTNDTGAEAMDSKNFNSEGVQVGDTIVAVGPIGGLWYPPTIDIKQCPSDVVSSGSNGSNGACITSSAPTQIPLDTSCDTVKNKVSKFGTTTRTDNTRSRTSGGANDIKLIVSSNPADWTITIKSNQEGSAEVLPNLKSEVAKSYHITWLDCPPGDLKCREQKPGFWGNMAMQSALGYIGSTVSAFGGMLPVGAAIVAGISYMGIDQLINCAITEAAKQEGTFVINGLIVTSHSGFYLIHHGPTMEFSPGYTPTIIPTIPPLGIYNCANRYTIRKYVSAFRTTYGSSKQIQKIHRITPRRDTSIERIPLGHPINNELSCVFSTEYLDIASGRSITKDFKILMNKNTSDYPNLITYQPSNNVYDTGIPNPEPFTLSMNEPPIPTLVTTDIRPSRCRQVVDCSNPQLQARLFSQFEANHLGILIDNRPGSASLKTLGTFGQVSNPINAWTPLTESENKQCVFNLVLTEYTDIHTEPLPLPTYKQRRVTMDLKEVLNPTADTVCLFDLVTDDYPYYVWYTQIPDKELTIPAGATEINKNFQPNSPNCPELTDCSGTALIANLVTQFNKKYTDRKINTVFRSFTPITRAPPVPVCDYDVEMFRTDGITSVVNKETVRMYLKQTTDMTTYPGGCMYDLDKDDSNTSDSGLSLNNSSMIGGLENSYTWSSDFTNTIRRTLNNYILPVLGLNSVETVKAASKSMKNAIVTTYNDSVLVQKLQACPTLACNDPYILQKIINRYNFINSPVYPSNQYKSLQRSITSFRRAGIASPTRCHVEFIGTETTYDDILMTALNENIRASLLQYEFDTVNGNTNCVFTIKPFTQDDITNGKLSVSNDPYGIQSDSTIVDPNLNGKTIINPVSGSSASGTFTYATPTVNCMDPFVLTKIRSIYESIDVSYPTVVPKQAKYNKMVSVLEWFNPVPNICEYKMNIQHQYYDTDYGYYYKVPATTTFSTADTPTYITATWTPDTDYDIETGTLIKNTPTVKEFFLPNFDARSNGKIYESTDTNAAEVVFPYLANEDITPVPSQTRRYTIITPPYKF